MKKFGLGAAAMLLLLSACPKDKPPPPETKPVVSIADASREAAPTTPSIAKNANVILITIDCLRADMPWAGYPLDIAPNLGKLAQKSVMYTRAYSISSYTSMSLGGFLGGKLPS